jgi:RNA polymerase sigma-70 factor (ECF subfamily)
MIWSVTSGVREKKLVELDAMMSSVKKGSEVALGDLMRYTAYALEYLAGRLLYDKNLCFDVVQETFVKVWQQREKYCDGRPAWPWIAQILRNECYSVWRKNGGRRKDLTSQKTNSEISEYIHCTAPLQDCTNEQTQLCNFVRDFVAELSDPIREVLQLSLFSELSELEIASLLGVPAGTVKSRKNRGIKKVKEQMARLNGGIIDGPTE